MANRKKERFHNIQGLTLFKVRGGADKGVPTAYERCSLTAVSTYLSSHNIAYSALYFTYCTIHYRSKLEQLAAG